MANDATIMEVYELFREWEQLELVAVHPVFQSFPTFPTREDVQAGLTYPYTGHVGERSRFEVVSVSQTPTLRDEQTHTFWTFLLFGAATDPLDKLSERDALWRDEYRKAFVRHLTLGGNVIGMSMGEALPASLNLFGRPEVGIKVPVTYSVKVTLTSGTG